MRFDKAEGMLGRRGILFFDWNQRGGDVYFPDHRLVVVAINPRPRTIIHPPHFKVTVTTAPRH
jgi:hypothetical protein